MGCCGKENALMNGRQYPKEVILTGDAAYQMLTIG